MSRRITLFAAGAGLVTETFDSVTSDLSSPASAPPLMIGGLGAPGFLRPRRG